MTCGKISVFTGPMRSGKTNELILNLNKYKIANKKIILIKPKKDTRDKESLFSRSGLRFEDSAYLVNDIDGIINTVQDIIKKNGLPDMLAIDECHFFSSKNKKDYLRLTALLFFLSMKKCNVIVCGLDSDWTGTPIDIISHMMSIADEVKKIPAICCNLKEENATMTYSNSFLKNGRVPGGDDMYKPLSRSQWFKSNLGRDIDLIKEIKIIENTIGESY